jgi:hypothetical protein
LRRGGIEARHARDARLLQVHRCPVDIDVHLIPAKPRRKEGAHIGSACLLERMAEAGFCDS